MRYVTGFLGLIAIVIAVIVGAILFRNTLRSNTTNNGPDRVMVADQLEEGTVVRIRTEGPVVANELHESAQIDVSATGRSVTFFKTYDKVVNKFSSYSNNQDAFRSFALALDRQGFTLANRAKADDPYRGECAIGNVYYLELLKNGETTQSLWATSCGIPAAFAGNLSPIVQLFKAQIPDYPTVSTGVAISF